MSEVSTHPRSRWRLWGAALAVVVAAGLGWHFFGDKLTGRTPPKAQAATSGEGGAKPNGPGQGAAPVPVSVAAAETADMPVFVNGLGTVQPLNTVVVRTRVDGQIQKIAFQEGDLVHEGDLLAQIDPRPLQASLDQAIAKKAQDEAQLGSAQSDLARTNQLVSREYATRQQQEQQTAGVGQLSAQLQFDQAAIDAARAQLSYATITAPISGRTGFRLVDQGNIVHPADTTGIVEITQLAPISVVFTAPESELDAIRKALREGSPAVDALTPDGVRTLAHGVLSLINNEVDTATGTIRLKATFTNQNTELWPGSSVATKLLVTTVKDAVVVPETAVQRGQQSLYVWVVKSDNTVERRDIKGGATDGKRRAVEGLQAGDKVVIDGQYRLQQGSPVKPGDAKDPASTPEQTAAKG